MTSIEAPATRSAWSGKLAFILAGAASAVGLGNMWRFPYLAAKFGGGTFLLTYLVLVLTFGLSLLLLETALGRRTGKSAITAFSEFGKKFVFIGILASLVPFIITPYYCIIGGWVVKYAVSYLAVGASALADGGDFFVNFLYSDWESYIWMLIFMAMVFAVVALGVKKGIEKANKIMMPALIIMALIIAIYVICQPGAMDGVAYYLVPDFSKFSSDLVINALGQMFYSLSLAMGIMITYGSYLAKKESLTTSVASIAGFDLGVSVIAGLMIVPAAFAFMGGDIYTKAGPSLMFITLPQVFDKMGGIAVAIGFIFFLLVLFAALTSAISLMETCVSIVQDGLGWSRKKSLIGAMIAVVALGVFVNLGYNGLSSGRIMGMEFLDFFDFISNSVLMPIVALLTCAFVGWVVVTNKEGKQVKLIDEISGEVKESSPFKLEKAWTIMVKFVCPVLVVVILVWNIIGIL